MNRLSVKSVLKLFTHEDKLDMFKQLQKDVKIACLYYYDYQLMDNILIFRYDYINNNNLAKQIIDNDNLYYSSHSMNSDEKNF